MFLFDVTFGGRLRLFFWAIAWRARVENRAAIQRFERRLWLRPLCPNIEINEDGLVLGAGTILARMIRDPLDRQVLLFDSDRPRLLALLTAAYGQSPPSDLLVHLESAARFWKQGDKALANIRLAFARLPRLDDEADAYRLFLAENMLDDGVTPDALMKLLDVAASHSTLTKYDPDQPRVPAGNGRNSGQWTSGAGAAAPAAGTLAEGLFSSL
jgi:hypothetical protein